MPTKRRRHAITETLPVQAALDELRQELGTDDVQLQELVILGAREKLARARAERNDTLTLRRRLANRIRSRDLPIDRSAADEVRRRWARS
jgi:adenine-specific DNA methylase